ncbi:hypothetical protein Ga0074812_105116 [Parafrankia irregularis]|uniref:Uncharacterized protein n=1 Tax=Parafrankia irregularis TaxID=795642 RepID=A0A0S4QLU4_9ACTN|nr:hypothetical protein Ga0074812_105116 [Parafrankia irregularis]
MRLGPEWDRLREWARHKAVSARGHSSSDVLEQIAWRTLDESRRATCGEALVAPRRVRVRLNSDDARRAETSLRTLGLELSQAGPAVQDVLTAALEREGRRQVWFHDDFSVILDGTPGVRQGRPQLTVESRADWGLQAFLADPRDSGRDRSRSLGPATVINRDLVFGVSRRRDSHISAEAHAEVRVNPDGRVTITPSRDPRHQAVVGDTPLVAEVTLSPRDPGYPLQVGHTWLNLFWDQGWFIFDDTAGRALPAPSVGHR